LEQRSRPEPADHAPRLAQGERCGGEDDVADGFREDAAQPEHDARAELRIAHQSGDQLAAAAHLLGDEDLDGAGLGPRPGAAPGAWAAPSRGGAGAGSWAAGARPAAASATPRRTRSRSVLCAIESPQSFTTTGKPSVSAARAAASGPAARASRATGIP